MTSLFTNWSTTPVFLFRVLFSLYIFSCLLNVSTHMPKTKINKTNPAIFFFQHCHFLGSSLFFYSSPHKNMKSSALVPAFLPAALLALNCVNLAQLDHFSQHSLCCLVVGSVSHAGCFVHNSEMKIEARVTLAGSEGLCRAPPNCHWSNDMGPAPSPSSSSSCRMPS